MGIKVGRYEVVEALGEGGMGVVYSAIDPMLERQVAIKVIHPRRINKEAKDRFLREARAVARLDSPHIVKIYDIGSQIEAGKELHFIVMEMVPGKTLSGMLEGTDAPQRKVLVERLKTFWQLLKAMSYAHENGVVHRDLKPDNVMVAKDGRVKVMDFGLAVINDDHSQTRDDQIMGTMAYFAPEQAKGGKTIDHRADIYALGVILFEITTGQLPLMGQNPVEMIYKLLNEIPAPLSKLNPGIPKGLDKIAARALKKEPIERYQRVTEMIKDIETVLAEGYQVGTSGLDPDAPPSPVPTTPPPRVAELTNASSLSFKMPKITVPPPPSLLATSAEIFEKAALSFQKPASDAPRTALDVAPMLESNASVTTPPPTSKKVAATATGGPVVASPGWLDEVSQPGAPSEEPPPRPVEQVASAPLAGRRQMCSCGASVALDARVCPECNQPMRSSFYLVSREAQDMLQRAKNAMIEGDFEEAIEAASIAIEKDTTLAEAFLVLGKAELGLLLYDEARIHLEKAHSLMPSSVDPALALAELHSAQGNIESVIGCLQQVLERVPQDVDTRCRLAFLYSETARLNEALEQYRKVLKINPRHGLANRQMGVLLFRADRTEEALKYLELAHQVDPDDGQSCVLLGRIYAGRRQFAQAEVAFQNAVRLKPEESSLRAELGALFQAQSRDDDAIRELRQALELDGGNRTARLRLAGIFERHSRFDYALRELDEALRYHPQDIGVHKRLGEIYLKRNDLASALKHLNTVVELDPRCAEMHAALGKIHLKRNYAEKSIEHYQKAVELKRLEPELYEDLAMAYYAHNDTASAIKQLHKAATLDSRNFDYLKQLGILYYAHGDDREADRFLRGYLQQRPNDAQAHGILGQTLVRQGLSGFAVGEFSRTLELEPSLHIVHLLLARAYAAIGKHPEAIVSFRNFASKLSGGEESFGGQAYLEMGQSYLATGQMVRASEVFQMALKRNPKDAGALLGLGLVAMAKGDLAGAEERLREARVIEPRNPRVLEATADLQGLEGNWNEAVVTLQKAIADNPTVFDLHEFLGRAQRKAGRYADAAATFRRAGELFPKRASRCAWLEGRIEVRMERFQEGASLFRKALERAPGDPQISLDLAKACQQLQRYDEGMQVIDTALQHASSKHAANLRRQRQLIEEDKLRRR